MAGKDKDFYRGMAVVLGSLVRDRDLPSIALDIMHMNGVTLTDLEVAEVDDFDLTPIRREWKLAQPPPNDLEAEGGSK